MAESHFWAPQPVLLVCKFNKEQLNIEEEYLYSTRTIKYLTRTINQLNI